MSPHDQWKTAPNLTDDFPPLISLAPPSDQLGYERGAGIPNQGDTGIWIDAQVLALACCAPRREEEADTGVPAVKVVSEASGQLGRGCCENRAGRG